MMPLNEAYGLKVIQFDKALKVTLVAAGPKIVCFLTQSVQLTLSSVQLTLLECVM